MNALLWFLIAVFGLIFIFLCICLVVDGHLVPAVEVIIEEFSLPEEIAAVTLIAFGSSTPEIVLNTISAVDKASSLSMPALLGSAMIAFGFIPAICILYNQKREILLDTGPVARETIFYLLGLFLFMNIIHDGVSTTKESIAMISLYFFYVAFVVGRYLLNRKAAEDSLHLSQLNHETALAPPSPPTSTTSTSDDLMHRVHIYFELISNPLVWFFKMTIPSIRTGVVESPSDSLKDPEQQPLQPSESEQLTEQEQEETHVCNPERYLSCILRRQSSSEQCHPMIVGPHRIVGLFQASLCRALCCIVVCIFYIGVFASLIVQASSVIVQHVGLSQTTVGATLVSLGTEIPDLISSIVLSRDGYYGAAFAGATGSQVINITLGAGLPAFMMCIYGDGKFRVDDQATSLNLLVVLVMVIILGYLWLTTPISALTRCFGSSRSNESIVTRLGAFNQLFLFLVAYLTYIVFNE